VETGAAHDQAVKFWEHPDTGGEEIFGPKRKTTKERGGREARKTSSTTRREEDPFFGEEPQIHMVPYTGKTGFKQSDAWGLTLPAWQSVVVYIPAQPIPPQTEVLGRSYTLQSLKDEAKR